MRSKSFAVRSLPHRNNSLDPYPSPASIPGEANERLVSGVNTTQCDSGDAADDEIVPDTFDDSDVPPRKRHCPETSETSRGEGSSLEACIVCDISDEGVSRCSGTGCFISFHWECLNPEFGSSEDLAKSYCPYCWYKVVVMKHESVREKAEKEVSKCLSEQTKNRDEIEESVRNKDRSSEKEQLHVEKDSDKPREDMPLTEERDYQPQEDTGKFQDAEEDKDEETAKDQTNVTTVAAGGNGDVSGKEQEQDQIQRNERPRRRRRRQLILDDTDSEISSDESKDDVAEKMDQVVTFPSGTVKNQQIKHSAITKVANSETVRDISYFNREPRKRLFWTPEEEEMLRVGVEKFSAEAKKNMPWRKILEMGQEVFHETRTPADLKDKWRSRLGTRGKKTN